MAIGPNDILPFDTNEVIYLESEIDNHLKKYRGTEPRITIHVKKKYGKGTQDEISRRYLKVGWSKVSFEDYYGSQWDPADEHYVTLVR